MTPLNKMKIRGLDEFENSRSIRSITASHCRTEESKNIKNKVNNKLRPDSLKNVYSKKFNKKS